MNEPWLPTPPDPEPTCPACGEAGWNDWLSRCDICGTTIEELAEAIAAPKENAVTHEWTTVKIVDTKMPTVLLEVANARHALQAAEADARAGLLQAVVRARLNHYTLQEIADACGMSEAGVRKMLRTARKE